MEDQTASKIYAKLTREPILIEQLWKDMQKMTELFHGAQVIFTGTVRSPNQGKTVLGVSYDAFPPLTETIFHQICTEALQQWGPDLTIRLVHRFGKVQVSELSIAIIVCSRHRDEAYLTSRFIIEEVKHRAPIWKQEHYENENSAWLQGHALCGHRNLQLNS
jgi:molybdopterin synthase catalytic subunit